MVVETDLERVVLTASEVNTAVSFNSSLAALDFRSQQSF